MAGFLYFLADARENQVRELLPMRGLGYVVSPGLRSRGVNSGPAGAAGIVVADRDRVDTVHVGYHADAQTWRRMPGQAGAWVGLVNESRPGPSDLAKPERIDGENVILGDGQAWHVPHAIDYAGPGLDRVMELDDSGHWVTGEIVARHRRLWDLAWEWRGAIDALVAWGDDHRDSAGSPSFDGFADERMEIQWILSRSVEVLAANYVIGPAEASMLGLFVSGRRWSVLQALCDTGGLRAIAEGVIEQKKTDVSPATTPGSADG